MSLPALACLSRNYPAAEIWAAGPPWTGDLIKGKDFVTGTLSLSGRVSLSSLRTDARRIKSLEFDTGLLLTNSFSSALLFYLAGIPHRWGYRRDSRGILLTRAIRPPAAEPPAHQVHYYCSLLTGLGIPPCTPNLSLEVTGDETQDTGRLLLSHGIDPQAPIVALNPGAFYGPAKRWPPSRFAELAGRLHEAGYQVLIVGSHEERPIANEIARKAKAAPAVLSGETTLRQLISLISQVSLFITNDSGPMHIANALQVPVVAIFGPTDFRVTGPFQEPSAIVRKEASCWPCSHRTCPLDHRCMLDITAEDVFRASLQFLK